LQENRLRERTPLKAFSILGGTLLLVAILSFFPVIRSWWQALLSRPGPAIFLILALVNTLFSTGEQADIAAIQRGAVDPYRIVRALLTSGLFTVASLRIFNDISRFKLAGGGTWWMLAYAFLAIVSATYSVNAFVSFWKGFEVLTLVLIAVSLAGQLRSTEDLSWLMNVASFLLFYVVLTVYVGLALYPGEAIKDVSYLGVRGLIPMLNPSSVGTISVLLIIFAASTLLYRWPSKKTTAGTWVVLVAAVGMMVLAHVRTPIFAVAVATMAMLVSGKHYRAMIITAVVGIGLVLAMSMDDIMSYIYRGQTQEAFVGLTGRMYFWDKMWEKISSSPIIGHGYYAAQRILFDVNAVDNSYLEVIFGLGFLGLLVFLMPSLYAMKNLLRMRPKSGMPVANQFLWAQLMGLFTVLIIRGLSGSSYQVQHPLLIFYMLMQIGIAALVRLNYEKTPVKTVTDTQVEHTNTNLLQKRKHHILSARRR